MLMLCYANQIMFIACTCSMYCILLYGGLNYLPLVAMAASSTVVSADDW